MAVPTRTEASWQPRRARRDRGRVDDHTQRAFDLMYEDIREHALAHRRTPNGMRVARNDPANPTPVTMDEYVSELVRAVRNSSHGFSEVLRENSGLLVATHEGRMPSQLSNVAALVMLGLLADADRLCAGTWWYPSGTVTAINGGGAPARY